MQSAQITIANQLQDIHRVSSLIDGFCRRNGVSQLHANEVHVILDEVLTNVIRHGYDDSLRHEISVSFGIDQAEMTAEIEDGGKPFDPTKAVAIPERPSLAQTKIGGLGLPFLHALCDSLIYRRVGDRNRLTIRTHIDRNGAPAKNTPHGRLRLSDTRLNGVGVLITQGRLDSSSADTFKDRFVGLIEVCGPRVIVDLSLLSHISSAGFRTFLLAQRLVREAGGAMVLCELSEVLAKLVADSGLGGELRITRTRAEALVELQATNN